MNIDGLGEALVEQLVESGMVVGLGGGSTAALAIRRIAAVASSAPPVAANALRVIRCALMADLQCQVRRIAADANQSVPAAQPYAKMPAIEHRPERHSSRR